MGNSKSLVFANVTTQIAPVALRLNMVYLVRLAIIAKAKTVMKYLIDFGVSIRKGKPNSYP